MPNQITLYHHPGCSKSRAALQLLQQHDDADLNVIEYKKTPPDAVTLATILKLLNLNASELMRRGEAQYKSLQPTIDSYSESALIDLMVEYPILIERPIVVAENDAAIGRPIQNVIDLLERIS